MSNPLSLVQLLAELAGARLLLRREDDVHLLVAAVELPNGLQILAVERSGRDGIRVIVDPTPEELETARAGDPWQIWSSERAKRLASGEWPVMWKYTGRARPPFAIPPGEGQESVWDYPRPPRLEPDRRRVEVRVGEVLIAETTRSCRVLETAGPPTFYLPAEDVDRGFLIAGPAISICEWKGRAVYWTIRGTDFEIENGAWSYPDPWPGFEAIRDFLSFYPSRFACTVSGIRVEPQPGGFYGGWVTPEVVGPFKGEPGTEWW